MKSVVVLLRVLGLLGVMSLPAGAQVVLNEVLAVNAGRVENGNDTPDYVELFNPSAAPISLAGMSLSDNPGDPRRYVFPAGTTLPSRGFLVVWCDDQVSSPGLHAGFSLNGSGEQVRLYSSDGAMLDEVVFGLQVADLAVGRIPDGSAEWALTEPTLGAANRQQSLGAPDQLRINEWMARPARGDDWVELFNGAAAPVQLAGLVMTDLESGSPTNRAVPALSFIGARGFVQLLASGLKSPDANHLDFRLGNNGETLTLYAADRTTVYDTVTFGAQVEDVAEGRVPDGSDRITTLDLASPGAPNFVRLTTVVISEVLSHTDPPLEDAIELHNLTDANVDISHWWLSDAAATPKKYRIPAGTTIPAGGFRVFYQYQFGAGSAGFSLDSAEGDEVFLSAADAAGELTGPQTFAQFGALYNGLSAGRQVTSTGVDFVPLRQRTFGRDNPGSLPEFRQGEGASNAPAMVGPVVISEILFEPDIPGATNGGWEFIEIHNPTTVSVPLYDPAFPTNTWRLREGITYNFPANVRLPAGGTLLLVEFDPSAEPTQLNAFREAYGVLSTVPVLGPYGGRLNNAGESIALLAPDAPQGPETPQPGFVPYVLIERVRYLSASPWPLTAAGQSLQRRDTSAYGNEPLHWQSGVPTAGSTVAIPDSDRDGDGMPNDWEQLHGLNPDLAADGLGDADQDGASNRDEYLAGTLPRESQSVLRIFLSRTGSGLTLVSPTVPGREYVLQRRSRLTAPWQTLTNFTAGSAATILDIPQSGSDRSVVVFRLGVLGPSQ